MQTLSEEKNNLFDQLQLRQAEAESSQSLLQVLQSQNTELQYQLREQNDRIALLNEEIGEAHQDMVMDTSGSSTSAEEVAKLLSAAETRYEAKLSAARHKVTAMEAERMELEMDWSRKLEQTTQEADKWKALVESTTRLQEESNRSVQRLEADLDRTKVEARSYRVQVSQLELQIEQLAHAEVCKTLSTFVPMTDTRTRTPPSNSAQSWHPRLLPWNTRWKTFKLKSYRRGQVIR